MSETPESKPAQVERLEAQLDALKNALPEHCTGTDGYIALHRANPEHWQKIEELEDQIGKLKAEIGSDAS